MSKESSDKILDLNHTEKPNYQGSKAGYVIRQILFWVGLFLLSQIIGSILFVSLAQTINSLLGNTNIIDFDSSVTLRFGLLLSVYISTLFAIFLVIRSRKITFKSIGFTTKNLPLNVIYGFLIYAVYLATFITLNIIISSFVPAIDSEQTQQLGFPDPSGYEFALIFVILTVFPPLVEEFIFRGMIFGKIRKVINWKLAAVVTSVVFGLLHLEFFSGTSLNWIAAVDTGVFSLFLCYAYQKTNSLWTPIIIHFIKNSLAFVVLFIIKFNG